MRSKIFLYNEDTVCNVQFLNYVKMLNDGFNWVQIWNFNFIYTRYSTLINIAHLKRCVAVNWKLLNTSKCLLKSHLAHGLDIYKKHLLCNCLCSIMVFTHLLCSGFHKTIVYISLSALPFYWTWLYVKRFNLFL